MEASKPKKQKGPKGFGALVFKDGVPHYELAATELKIAMQQRLDSGTIHHLPTTLSVPKPENVFNLLEAQKVVTRPIAGEDGVTEDVRLNPDVDAGFFDEHVVEVFHRNKNRKQTKDEIEQLGLLYNFKANTVNRGFLKVLGPAHEEDEQAEELLPSKPVVSLSYLLADENGDEHRVSISMTFRLRTAADVHEMRRAIRSRTLKDGSQLTMIKHRRLSKLFRSMIRSAEGLLVDGKPCTEENRSEWVDKVPIHFQFNSIIRQYRGADLAGN